MDIKITFRHMDHSDVMEKYAYDQLAKITDFLQNERDPIFIELVFEPSKAREHHRVELRIKTPRYDKVSNYEKQGMQFYDVLDRVIDVMYRQLLEEKDKQECEKKMRGRHDEFKKQR